MPKAPARITQAEIARAIKAAKAGGVDVGRYEIRPDGTLVVFARGECGDDSRNPCDELLR